MILELIQDGAWLRSGLMALLTAGVRAALLLALVLGLGLLLRRSSAATRHALWSAGFMVALLLPLSGLLPWRLPLLPERLVVTGTAGAVQTPAVARSAEALPEAVSAPAPAQAAPDAEDGWRLEAARPPLQTTGMEAAPQLDPAVGVSAGESDKGQQPLAFLWSAVRGDRGTLPALLLFGWLAGLLFVGGRLGAGHWIVRRLVRRAQPVTDPSWTTPLWESADRLEIDRDVAVLRSESASIPFATGVLRPTIVLPASADAWEEGRRRAVLMHELAHVRRRDLVLHYLSRWACVLYWFNPLVWLGARRLRAESERAADDLVLSVGTRPSDYADHLLQIVAGVGGAAMPAPALPLAQRREFEGRMLAILEPHQSRRGVNRLETAALTVLVAFLALPLAALAPAGSAQTQPEQARTTQESDGSSAMAGDIWSGSDSKPKPAEQAVAAQDAEQATADQDAERNQDRQNRERVVSGEPTQAWQNAREQAATTDELDGALLEILASAATAGAAMGAESFDVAMRSISEGVVEVRVKAAHELASAEQDPRAVQALIRLLLEDPVADVRAAAARALGEMEAGEAVPALGQALTRDSDPDVRATAAWALGEIEDARAADALVTAIGDQSGKVREAAIWALGELEDSRAVPALIKALHSGNVQAARKAAWALGEIEDPRAVDALIDALTTSKDAEVRQFSAWALGEIEDPRASEALALALSDDSPDVRQAAIHALGELEDPAAAPGLISALSDADPQVRAYAAFALGEAGIDRAPEPLVALLRDSSPMVRAASAQALGEIEDPATVPALAAAVDDSDEKVRQMVVWALAEMDSGEAMEALLRALNDENPAIRRHAAEALAEQ